MKTRKFSEEQIIGFLRPHVLDTALGDGYRAIAADTDREFEAHEWCNVLSK